MDPFNLDARVSTPAAGNSSAAPASVTTLVTKTPVCTKATCKCTSMGACTAGCPVRR